MINSLNRHLKTTAKSLPNQNFNEMAIIISEAIMDNHPVHVRTIGGEGQVEYIGTIGRLDTLLKWIQIIPDHDGWAWISMDCIIEIRLKNFKVQERVT